MRLCFVFTIFVVAANALSTEQEWESFKLEHGKQYDSEFEERLRFKVFRQNKDKIARHNKRYQQGKETYYMGLNEYADLSHQEFLNYLTVNLSNYMNDDVGEGELIIPDDVNVPSSIDWRDYGAVTPAKNQGKCGSCWAFAANAALEGHYKLRKGKLHDLSEQNLLDCSRSYGNEGCDGGWVTKAFQYIQDNHGIDGERSYRYEANEGNCRYQPKYSLATDCGYRGTPKKSESHLKSVVGKSGPVAIAIDATNLHLYKYGIYYDPKCKSDNLNHAMTVIGYGHDGKHDYWLIKNSWGRSWGQRGFMYLLRNHHNHCGVASNPIFPTICN